MEKIFLKTHVTALVTIDPHILLEGSGGFLSLYDLKENKLVCKIDLFNGSRIHDIRILRNNAKSNVIVYGGKHIAVLQVTTERLTVSRKWEENDWIQDALFINSAQDLVILTSHNRAIICDWSSGDVTSQIDCDEHCILYSGQILGDNFNNLIILSGTVFGEILIWAVRSTGDKILHRLSGHKGVIFSVNYDEETGTIISTSDDRSVRTWKAVPNDGESNNAPADLWNIFQHSQVVAEHELYGHEARVWNSLIIRQSPEDRGQIASIGEDSRVCLWDLQSGKLCLQFEAHPGASIWSSHWSDSQKTLVTGGGDGAIHLWNVSHLLESNCRLLTMPRKNDIPRLVAVSSDYLTVTDRGLIYGWNEKEENWVQLYDDERLRKGCVMDVRDDTVIFGTMGGTVLVFRTSPGLILTLVETQQSEGAKIYSVHLVGSNQFLLCLNEGRMILQDFEGDPASPKARYVLPAAKQRWPGCALIPKDVVVVGDREGSLHLYSSKDQAADQSFNHIHGKNGLTDIRQDQQDGNCFYTSGKDGRVGFWRLKGPTQLELVSVINTSLGWIARLLWIGQDLIYLAFHSDQFVVWSSRQQRSLMKVTCGGGHRSWDFYVSESLVNFIFVKDKQIYQSSRPRDSVFSPTLEGKAAGHSKSICAAKLVGGFPLLVTGSEDTTIRISRLEDQSLQCLATVPKHISSVRAVAVLELESGKWLCLSAGGRAQLTAGLIEVTGDNHVIYQDVRTHYLRGLMARRSYKPWTSVAELQLVPDPETRYMDLDMTAVDALHFYIFAACSDGFIRVFKLSLETNQVEVIQELSFHNCCVLKVKILQDGSGRKILVSAGTNGHLAFWNLGGQEAADQPLVPFGSLKVHQSGINSLDCRWIEDCRWLILTGGDDNALICSLVDVGNGLRLIGQHRESPHAAQISGVAVLGSDLAVSVSLDQRLILWKIRETQLDWHSSLCCDVSDIQGLDVFGASTGAVTLCVYGQGVQIFRLNQDSLLLSKCVN